MAHAAQIQASTTAPTVSQERANAPGSGRSVPVCSPLVFLPVFKEANQGVTRRKKSSFCGAFPKQGRQDSNLQPPVLETGALPIVLLPFGRAIVFGAPGWEPVVATRSTGTEALSFAPLRAKCCGCTKAFQAFRAGSIPVARFSEPASSPSPGSAVAGHPSVPPRSIR
jgi:hypothetical protein